LPNELRFAAGAAMVLAAALFAGCGPSEADRAAMAQQQAAQAQESAARAQQAADQAMAAAQAATIAADRAVKAVHDATVEINRVSDHLDKLNQENSAPSTR
jgi:hypothetical protein